MGTTNQAKDKEPQTSNPWFGVYRNDEITKQFGGGVRTFQDSGFVMLCNSGSVVMSVNGIKYKIERNHLFVVYPRVDVSLYDITEDFDGVLLEINVNMVNYLSVGSGIRAYVQVAQSPLVTISDDEREMLLESIDFLQRRSECKIAYYRSQLYTNLIRGFCYEVACVVRQNLNIDEVNGSRKNQIFQRFIKEVMVHYATEHRVEFYANRLGMTAKYLCMVVKEVSNIPPQNWINEVIIRSAKVMLSTTDMSINEITRQLNFPNPSFFCQYFKRSVGQTPLKYRKYYK
ncbi:MAG: helix-turn-helix transcriptional regulator [Rikenellaceae bacterium]|nr:helix-turn-helix transcriptional regulator [Rikenellaceae bacterium]